MNRDIQSHNSVPHHLSDYTSVEKNMSARYFEARGISNITISYFEIVPKGTGFTYPILDIDGRQIGRRWRANNSQANTRFFWEQGQEHAQSVFYNMPALKLSSDGSIWYVNGESSVWALHSAGILNVISNTSGENNPPHNFGELLRGAGISKIYYPFDNDETGHRAAAKIKQLCMSNGLEFFPIDMKLAWKLVNQTLFSNLQIPPAPKGADVADYLQRFGLDSEKRLVEREKLLQLFEVLYNASLYTHVEAASNETGNYTYQSAKSYTDYPTLNPAFVQAIESRLLEQGGKHKEGHSLGIYSIHPHAHDTPGKHCTYYFEKKAAFDFARGDFILLKELAHYLGIDPKDYGGIYARKKAPEKRHRLRGKKIIDLNQWRTQIQEAHGEDAPQPSLEVILGERANLNRVHIRYLTEESNRLEARALGIRSAIGTGKTQRLIKYLREQLAQGKRILWLIHRVSLAKGTDARMYLEGLLAEVYINFYPWMYQEVGIPLFLIMSFDSFHHLCGPDGKILGDFDIVVIDESEQGLQHLMGDTFKGTEGVRTHTLISETIRQSKQVIVADANLSRLSIDWISNIVGEPVEVLANTYTIERGDMWLVHNDRQLKTLTMQALLNPNRTAPVIVVCESVRQAKAFHNENGVGMFQRLGLKGRAVYGTNSSHRATEEFITNINTELPKLDYLVYTSAMGTGVDVTVPVHGIYAFFENNTLTLDDQFQMLGRCRRADTFYVHSPIVDREYDTDPEAIKAKFMANIAHHATFGKIYEFDKNGKPTLPANAEAYLDLFCRVDAYQGQQKNNQFRQFILRANQEFKIQLNYTPKVDSTLREMEKSVYQELAEREKETFFTVPRLISEEEYLQIQNRGDITPEIEAAYQLWKSLQFWGVFDARRYHKKGRRNLQQIYFENMRRTKDELLQFDQWEHNENVSVHRRNFWLLKRNSRDQLLETIFDGEIHSNLIERSELEARLEIFNQLYEDMEADRVYMRRNHESKKPLARLRFILKREGLSLKLFQTTRDGKRVDFYYVPAEQIAELAGDAIIRHTLNRNSSNFLEVCEKLYQQYGDGSPLTEIHITPYTPKTEEDMPPQAEQEWITINLESLTFTPHQGESPPAKLDCVPIAVYKHFIREPEP